ncbi:MAG TPA: phosphoesterase, partial [Candidatus Methanoperedenaceae archaeon]|nr:phosphoesterase [Candidatus Methanoperedenaceae archaeon]
MITPIVNEPALVSRDRIKVLSVADVHLGIEWELRMGGISIPSQADAHKRRLRELIKKERPDAIVLLGDVKHNVPYTSRQEWREVPEFLGALGELADVHIVPGNHDGDLERLIGGVHNVSMHPMGGFVLDGVGYVHGHAWPSAELYSAGCIVMSHNHPAVRFTD